MAVYSPAASGESCGQNSSYLWRQGNDAAKKNTAKNAFDGERFFDFDLASLWRPY